MSINIQTSNGLQKIISDNLTKTKVINALGYTPANATTLEKYVSQIDAELAKKSEFSGSYYDLINAPDIIEDNSGSIHYADENGNIIATIDKQGVSSIEFYADGTPIKNTLNSHINDNKKHISQTEKEYWNNKSEFSGDYSDLVNAPNILEDEGNNILFTDENNNIIAKIDENGFETTAVMAQRFIADGENVIEKINTHENNKNIHVSTTEKEYWNNKSEFDGNYDNLTNAPDIKENENGEVVFVDNDNNIIARLNDEGFQTTKISANAILLDGNNLSTKLEQINTEISNTNTNLSTHINDTIPHIQSGERDKWNSKLDEGQVSQMITAVIDSAPETLNTLNELAAALGDDPNFATTVATEIGKKVDKNDFSTHTNDMDLHVASGEKEYWNDKRYSSLTEAPHILEDESDRVVFADKENNIIAKIDKDGIATTIVTANKVLVDGVDATTKFNELNAHTTDTIRHVTQEDKNAWNAKTTATQAGEIAAEAATKVKNELLDNVATDANTLNKLNTKISNVNTSLTTHISNTNIHNSKTDIEGWIATAKNEAVNNSVSQVLGDIPATLNTLGKLNTDLLGKISSASDGAAENLQNHINNKVMHVTQNDKDNWDNKSTFSGEYDDLANAPINQEASTGELNIIDNQNYILAKFSKDGMFINKVSAKEVNVDGINATEKFNELNAHTTNAEIHVSKTKIEEYTTNATNNAVRIVVGNIDENLNTLEKLNTDVTNRINEKLDSNLGTELKNKILVVNEQGDIETTDRLGTLENKHETLKTDVLELITNVSTNKTNIQSNKDNIKTNADNISVNQKSIVELKSDVEDLNNEKVNKEDLAHWATYDGSTPKITIGVKGSYFEASENKTIIYDGQTTTTWEDGKMTSNEIVASTKLSTKEVAMDGGLSLKHVDNDGWYLM